MTNWEKLLDEHHMWFYQTGIAAVELPKKDFNWLKKECDKAKKNGVKNNQKLVGHIKEEYHIPGISSSFFNLICSTACEHQNFKRLEKKFRILSENKPLYLDSFWVNFMKKYEFNPMHNHEGLFSFVVFVKIPYDLKKEEGYFPDLPIREGKEEIQNSNFTFFNIDPTGEIIMTILKVDKSFEGKMLIFPSKQMHSVNPFYTSDDYRITVSGNLKIKV
tara:strand:- start:866 stop:1519 length:654 start_codon:yes stop_codon:yes gene_type:complete